MYPETVKAADRWLDGSGGRSSPFAATMRLADSSGCARSSRWCPGLEAEEPQAVQEHASHVAAHAHASSAALIASESPTAQLAREVSQAMEEDDRTSAHADASSSAPLPGDHLPSREVKPRRGMLMVWLSPGMQAQESLCRCIRHQSLLKSRPV